MADNEYTIVDGLLKDAGLNKNKVPVQTYGQLLNQVRSGNVDFSIQNGSVVLGSGSFADTFSDQYKSITSGISALAGKNAAISALGSVPGIGPLLGGAATAVAAKDTIDGKDGSFFDSVVSIAPRATLIIIGVVILALGLLALILNSGLGAAESALNSDTGKSVKKVAKLAALL